MILVFNGKHYKIEITLSYQGSLVKSICGIILFFQIRIKQLYIYTHTTIYIYIHVCVYILHNTIYMSMWEEGYI